MNYNSKHDKHFSFVITENTLWVLNMDNRTLELVFKRGNGANFMFVWIVATDTDDWLIQNNFTSPLGEKAFS
jgi:hypothetical protein